MKIIALEAATEACSAALNLDGEILGRYEVAPRAHTEKLLPMLESLLAEAQLTLADIDALAFGRGPGSFTGVRIATATAQGIAFSADLPVIPISTLAALAQRALDQTPAADAVLTAIDARMGEVYWCSFGRDPHGLATPLAQETLCPPEQAPVADTDPTNAIGAGTGWASYADALLDLFGNQPIPLLDQLLPDAASVSRLAAPRYAAGKTLPPEQAVPVYLRDNVAQRPRFVKDNENNPS